METPGFPGGTGIKNLPAMQEMQRHRFNPWVRKFPWNREWQPTPVSLPGEFHGQRSLVGYSPWGCRVGHNGVTEHTHTKTPFPGSHSPSHPSSPSSPYERSDPPIPANVNGTQTRIQGCVALGTLCPLLPLSWTVGMYTLHVVFFFGCKFVHTLWQL